MNDDRMEGDEYFTLLLSKPTSGATLAKASGQVTIKNGTSATLSRKAASSTDPINEGLSALSVWALPNPSANQFTLMIKSASIQPVNILITDELGRSIEVYTRVLSNSTLRVGGNYRPGMYLMQVEQGKERAILKLIKQAN